jgi:hypothetical protein
MTRNRVGRRQNSGEEYGEDMKQGDMVLGYKEKEVVKDVEKRDMGMSYIYGGGYGKNETAEDK